MEDPLPPPRTFAPASHPTTSIYQPHHSYDDNHNRNHDPHHYYNHYSYNYQPHPHHYQYPPPHRSSPDYPRPDDQHDCGYSHPDSYYHHHSQHPSQSQLTAGAYGHDSVISHPFSPKASSPPSPSSSVSSSGQRRKRGDVAGEGSGSASRSSPEIQPVQQSDHQPQPSINHSYPSPAHTDPEKAVASTQRTPRSHNTHSSNPDVTAVYETAEYKEKAPEEKAVQLLVC